MHKLSDNVFFILFLIIAIILTVVPSVLSVMGLGSYVRNAVCVILTPVQRLFTYISDGVAGFTKYFTEFDRLSEENEELKRQLEALSNQLYDAFVLEKENAWMRSYLGLRREHTDFKLSDAVIVGREAGNYITVFTLNKGSAHGIKVNMPVITETGALGRVTEVGVTWCKANSFIESSSSVGAYVERSGELGLVKGDYELMAQGLCKMTYLDMDADIRIGDRVLTTGLGSVFPKGLKIGKVVDLYPDEYSRSLVAVISPEADLLELSSVMIITEFTITESTEEPLTDRE